MCYGSSSSLSSYQEKSKNKKDNQAAITAENNHNNNNTTTMEKEDNFSTATTAGLSNTSTINVLLDPYEHHNAVPPTILPDAIQDLLAVDHFIDSCDKKYKTQNSSVMEELLAVDLAVDSAKCVTNVKTSEEGNVLLALIGTDNLMDGKKVEKVTLVDPYQHPSRDGNVAVTASSSEAQAEIEKSMSYLLATDELIDQTKATQPAKKDEHYHQLFMDLLKTDLEMQTSTKKSAAATMEEDPMEAMLKVDQMIDAVASSSAPLTSSASNEVINAASTPSGLTGVFAELYQVDQMIDGCHAKEDEHDDVEAIMDLLKVDQLIDGCKHESNSVYRELRSIDNLIDGNQKNKEANDEEFVDPITKATMKQYHVTSASTPYNTQDLKNVSDLLKVDQEIDNAKEAHENDEAFRPLLEVDQCIDGKKQHKKDVLDINDIQDLLAVDREIDAATAAKNAARQGNNKLAATAAEFHHGDHELTEAYAELYAVDHQIDHGRMTQKRHDDMSAIMDLIATDKLVDGCKISRADDPIVDIFKSLLSVDRTIDAACASGEKKGSVVEEDIKFIDPMAELSVRQYEARCHSARLMEEKGLLDVVDLLAVDVEIDGHKRFGKQMEGLLPLLEVDRTIDGWKETKAEDVEMEQIKALLEVDREVDQARSAMEAKKQQMEGNKEDLALDGVMLDLLRVDLEVDGAKGHWEKKHQLEDIQDLLAVDILVDACKGKKKAKDVNEIIDASLATLPLPPPPPQYSLQDVQDLLKVDQEIDGQKHKVSTITEVGDLVDLYKVDQEIDAAQAASILVSGVKPSTSNSAVGLDSKQRRVSMADPEEMEKAGIHTGTTTGSTMMNGTHTTTNNNNKKRSIFTAKEKQGAQTKCMVTPGTTTVISKKSLMIGDIPVGTTVPTTTNVVAPAGGDGVGKAQNPYQTATTSLNTRGANRRPSRRTSMKREKSDKCAIM